MHTTVRASVLPFLIIFRKGDDMQKLPKGARFLCPGLLCGALAIGLSVLAIRNLDVLPALAGRLFGLAPSTLAYAEQVLSQLRRAALEPAWIPVLLPGLLTGAVLLRVRPKWLAGCLWFFALLVLTVFSLGMIEVNGIRLGAALSALLPLLKQLL